MNFVSIIIIVIVILRTSIFTHAGSAMFFKKLVPWGSLKACSSRALARSCIMEHDCRMTMRASMARIMQLHECIISSKPCDVPACAHMMMTPVSRRFAAAALNRGEADEIDQVEFSCALFYVFPDKAFFQAWNVGEFVCVRQLMVSNPNMSVLGFGR
jgi:hypothetical protein